MSPTIPPPLRTWTCVTVPLYDAAIPGTYIAVLRGYDNPDSARLQTDRSDVSLFIYASVRWTGFDGSDDDVPREVVYLRRGICTDDTLSGLVLHEHSVDESAYIRDIAEYNADLRDACRAQVCDNVACRFSNLANFVADHGRDVGLWPGCLAVPSGVYVPATLNVIIPALSAALADGFAAV